MDLEDSAQVTRTTYRYSTVGILYPTGGGNIMSRIDTNIANQIGDAVRPQQTIVDRQAQVQTVQAQQAKAAEAGDDSMSSNDLHAVVAQLKQVVEATSSRRLSLNIDAESKQAFMQVTNMETGEVIKQIPTKEARSLHARLREIVGALINEEA
jgi:flagellar protein FlaG